MTVNFSVICSLLSGLEDLDSPNASLLLASERCLARRDILQSWFKSHRRALDALDVRGGCALLSALLPERRTDRVYGLQSSTLCNVLGRQLGFGTQRSRELRLFTQPGYGDLGTCLERAIQSGGPPAHPPVSLQEVDDFLELAARCCRFSSPDIRAGPHASNELRNEQLRQIYLRLSAREAKWLTRLILKDLAFLDINEQLVLKLYHFLLPDLIRFQDSLDASLKLLNGALAALPSAPDPRSELAFKRMVGEKLEPTIGIKVARPTFVKARSFDHCFRLLGRRKWIVERKHDGEYCEIHIERSKSTNPKECIQIYSKSGKNSTQDRKGIHQTIVRSLGLHLGECKILKHAILLGELVVWSDKENRVMPFDRIRKYVTRSGKSIGTDNDSPRDPHEHLAIVFYDLLLWDDEIVMKRGVAERRQWLRAIYKKIPGYTMGAEWKELDFSQDLTRSCKSLMQQFAAAMVNQCEGLVLKPCDVPYFPIGENSADLPYIKLKKDYFEGFGDEADFAVVGGSYDAQRNARTGVQDVNFTNFHLGCLINGDAALRFGARPVFKVVGTISAGDSCIPKDVLLGANELVSGIVATSPAKRSAIPFDLDPLPHVSISLMFSDPLVFEVLGSGFSKPSNQSYLMLRHPRVRKLHRDRSWKDCVTFDKLQRQGEASFQEANHNQQSQEITQLLNKFERKAARKFVLEQTSSVPTSPFIYKRHDLRTNLANTSNKQSANALNGAIVEYKELSAASLESLPTVLEKRSALELPTNTSHPYKKQHRRVAAMDQDQDNTSPRSTPLTDITNTAQQARSGAENSTDATGKALVSQNGKIMRRSCRSPPQSSQLTVLKGSCLSTNCAFAMTAIHAVPCIALTPYVIQDLVPMHDCILVPDLKEWDRDSFAYSPLRETVSESQAHIGFRKVVLVERERRTAVQRIVDELLELNDGMFREKVEIYDWRALEVCRGHSMNLESIEKYLLGTTRFDSGAQKTVFDSQLSWLQERC